MKSCFLTVSCPINAVLASFSTTKNKTRENSAVLRCRKKGYKNYHLHCTPIAPKLLLSMDRRFSFLEKVNLVPNIEPWPQEDEKSR